MKEVRQNELRASCKLAAEGKEKAHSKLHILHLTQKGKNFRLSLT